MSLQSGSAGQPVRVQPSGMRWDNPGMRGSGGGDARSGLLRNDEPRLFLAAEDAAPGTRIHWNGMFIGHIVAALVPLASLAYIAIRTYQDPCDNREDLEPQCKYQYFWLVLLGSKLSVWELAISGVYFAHAARCDRLAGQEATYLGAVDSQQAAGYGSMRETRGAPVYPHGCCGWRFHLCRVDSYTDHMLKGRDHLYSLAWPTNVFFVIGYWAFIFPCTDPDGSGGGCEVYEAALASPWDLTQTILQHVFAAMMLQVEFFIVHHRFQGIIIDLLVLMLFVGLYAAVTAIVHSTSGFWPYPSVQDGLSLRDAALLYGGVCGSLAILFLLFRVFNGCLWRSRIRREFVYARKMQVHREAANFS